MMILSSILDSEHSYWVDKESKAEPKDKMIINGGLCEVKMMIDFLDEIDRDWLLARHEFIKARKHETPMYKLASVSIARDKTRLEAVVRVDKALKEM